METIAAENDQIASVDAKKKEVTVSIGDKSPRYVIQHTAISRSIYKMSANARKTVALAMTYRKLKHRMIEEETGEKWEAEDVTSIEFPIKNFFETFDIEKSTKGVIGLVQTMNELTKLNIGIHHESEKKIEFMTWIEYAAIDQKNDEIQIEFSPQIAKYLDNNEIGYCELLLKDIAELKSFYAFRWLELAKSYESLAGKNGNKKEEWFFERDIQELRKIFGIADNQYQKLPDLKKRVIEDPIKEINNSKIGLKIQPEYKPDKNDKRKIKAIKLNCKRSLSRATKTLPNNKISITGDNITVSAEVPPVKVMKDYDATATIEKIAAKDPNLANLFKNLGTEIAEREDRKKTTSAEEKEDFHGS
jgi:plasmid replication initiation protein